MIYELTPEILETEFYKNELPILLRFGSPTCVPCKAFNPKLIKYAEKMEGKIKVYGCNIAKYPEIAKKFGVRAAPTFLIIKGDKVIDMKYGVLPIIEFKGWVERGVEKLK